MPSFYKLYTYCYCYDAIAYCLACLIGILFIWWYVWEIFRIYWTTALCTIKPDCLPAKFFARLSFGRSAPIISTEFKIFLLLQLADSASTLCQKRGMSLLLSFSAVTYWILYLFLPWYCTGLSDKILKLIYLQLAPAYNVSVTTLYIYRWYVNNQYCLWKNLFMQGLHDIIFKERILFYFSLLVEEVWDWRTLTLLQARYTGFVKSCIFVLYFWTNRKKEILHFWVFGCLSYFLCDVCVLLCISYLYLLLT